MSLRSAILVLCLVLGAPAWGVSALEAARTRAQAVRTEARGLRGQQQALRDELNALASRIETLKAERQGRLTTGSELEAALRRSQELSGSLTGLAQAVATAEGESERAHLALHQALSEELSRLRAAWDGTQDRAERARLLQAMRATRDERDAVRSALPASRVPSLERAAPGGDDPEDLLEQADTLRDAEDKVRERLKLLRARISEAREEKDLDRRMNDFLGEESMFDEQDRRLRLRLRSDSTLQVEPSQRSGGMFGGELMLDDSPSLPGAPSNGENPTPMPPTARATDRRPQFEGVRAQALASGGLADLAQLEAEERRLESLAGELDGRASALERRARELTRP
ncbi:TetR family transcriptional regulator [Myxococcus stipitatus]|uniref:TetR family transcriptional regulator n=1 Tax=Myxococcus stipitatus TaxID=83455 RepID=UPI001F236FCF|nr:TetR family transcriptional regulator [Myxococcus stipitatus]MCE9669319.1 TetR family transcriptional regulator [Myxococcus stipitatus]